MKIAILGKGTSAIINILTCLKRGHEVEVYYDPNTPHLNIGETVTPHIPKLILDTLKLSIGDLIDEKVVSLKHGIIFDGWGVGNTFKHYFNATNAIAFHFECSVFNEFFNGILEREIGIKYHPYKVEKYNIDLTKEKIIINDIEYDHLICCSGWKESDEYKPPRFKTVNNALLYSRECCDGEPYTYHIATEHGWKFGLTFPERKLMKHGYLFNDQITSVDEARESIGRPDAKHISWVPKYCKKMIQNRFVSYNGNRLAFSEPLHALSMHNYRIFAEYICSFVEDKKHETYVKYNQQYHHDLYATELAIAWHYSYGSKYKTAFWQDAKKRAEQFMNSSYIGDKDFYEDALYHDKKFGNHEMFGIGIFGYDDYFQIHAGMTGKKLEFKDTFINLL
jgi:hypothetical protein